jgi:ATP-dependent DNA ligase
VEHVESGTDLFQAISEQDMEGVVAKQANARYTPEATTWVKIKNELTARRLGARTSSTGAGRPDRLLQQPRPI